MLANGREEEISAPSLWWCADHDAARRDAELAAREVKQPQRVNLRDKRPQQMKLL